MPRHGCADGVARGDQLAALTWRGGGPAASVQNAAPGRWGRSCKPSERALPLPARRPPHAGGAGHPHRGQARRGEVHHGVATRTVKFMHVHRCHRCVCEIPPRRCPSAAPHCDCLHELAMLVGRTLRVSAQNGSGALPHTWRPPRQSPACFCLLRQCSTTALPLSSAGDSRLHVPPRPPPLPSTDNATHTPSDRARLATACRAKPPFTTWLTPARQRLATKAPPLALHRSRRRRHLTPSA